jgi:hypothetical protein
MRVMAAQCASPARRSRESTSQTNAARLPLRKFLRASAKVSGAQMGRAPCSGPSKMRLQPFVDSLPRLFLPLAAGVIALSLSHASARANDTFVIAANDGYGIAECLAPGSSCGQIVADAWCEAHGRGAAVTFGSADDVTGSIQKASAPVTPNAFVVTCGE